MVTGWHFVESQPIGQIIHPDQATTEEATPFHDQPSMLIGNAFPSSETGFHTYVPPSLTARISTL
jgi:hypothetical protein